MGAEILQPLGFRDLWAMLSVGDESRAIEAKTGESVGKSILETISAFSNEPGAGGGYLLLGVAPPTAASGYTVLGVPDPDKVQGDLASQCADAFSAVIRPHLAVEQVEGENVVIA